MGARVVWSALAALVLAGCGSRGPDEGELRAAIDAHLATTPKCIGDVAWRFPAELRSEYNPKLESHHAAMMARIEVLERAGLVRSAGADDGRWGKPVRYELTEAGRQAHREFPAGKWDARKPVGAFCYGKPMVDSVVRYTEPAEEMGQVQTEVTYTYRLRDVAPWAQDPELSRAAPEIERELGGGRRPGEAHAILVRASDGWRVVTLP
jgi:DNA-binding transcriptional ArsR family regulator